MPRQRKCRTICGLPNNTKFIPELSLNEKVVTLTLEEYESIRLVDYEGHDQSEAAKNMEVSRGTFQRILYSARNKVSIALVEGSKIIIRGGDYEVRDTSCSKKSSCCYCKKKKGEYYDHCNTNNQ